MVPRPYPEKNYPAAIRLRDPSGKLLEDNVPEDQSLVLDVDKGLAVLTGCGYACLINILTYARQTVRPAMQVYAALGGFHLFAAKADRLVWTVDKLKGFRVGQSWVPTASVIEPVYYFRERLELERNSCVVGAVCASFDLVKDTTRETLRSSGPQILTIHRLEAPTTVLRKQCRSRSRCTASVKSGGVRIHSGHRSIHFE